MNEQRRGTRRERRKKESKKKHLGSIFLTLIVLALALGGGYWAKTSFFDTKENTIPKTSEQKPAVKNNDEKPAEQPFQPTNKTIGKRDVAIYDEDLTSAKNYTTSAYYGYEVNLTKQATLNNKKYYLASLENQEIGWVEEESLTDDLTKTWEKLSEPALFPILMYHHISQGEDSLYVPKEEFDAHMQGLKEKGYYTLTPEEAYLVLTTNKVPSKKIIWVTLDDGYTDVYTNAFPTLKKLGLQATMNIITQPEYPDNKVTKEQRAELVNSGFVQLEDHTLNHIDLNALEPAEQERQMSESKKLLTEEIHRPVTTLCYPAGHYDETTVEIAKKVGYKMAVTTTYGFGASSDGLLELTRVRVSPGASKETFLAMIGEK
ncbi:SH3-like domain-containing protein [Pilibacter termitis]|uniref:SH3-like domain-containing protein n=1 Tax=Pilibacter termitis TaxID=263852 RepID=A0A1T4MGY8_9ENTE|nr:polysaccharide deacetylase family protein [Pilibacter termitis]SJZ66048.1 SH3-like domain-containing protein [Pilibacter termitis]